jgi:arginine decarboxylase
LYVPTKIFFTKGVGKLKDYLSSFEAALRNAGIEICNLVMVSSIFPPGCKIITRQEGLKCIQSGQITFVVMARNATNEPNRLIASSVGVAIPADGNNYGYLSEYHPFGVKEKIAGDYAEDLAAQMLATTLGVEFDSETAWNEREQVFKMSSKIVKTFNITQTA